MDPSALLFVALAAAWAVYLVPKALKHHESTQRGRSVERFSHRMRVLAHREPTSSRDARLVVTPGRSPSRPVIETKGSAPVASGPVVTNPAVISPAARRAAANLAARRRRNVLSAITLVLVVVTALASAGLFSAWWVAAPAAVLAAWLVACRVMVRSERAKPVARRTESSIVPSGSDADVDEPTQAHPVINARLFESSATLPAVEAELGPDHPSRWDMVPITLPTYVTKPTAARRSVQTIDLESTGVWTSGHSEADSALARAALEVKKAEAQAAGDNEQPRAVGH